MAEGRRDVEWERVAWHLAQISAMLGAKRPSVDSFMPKFDGRQSVEVAETTEDSAAALRAWARSIGAKGA